MVIHAEGRLCGCGGRGHLEAYASRTAIVRAILGELRLGRQSCLSPLAPDPNPDLPRNSQIRSGDLADAVAAGDAVAVQIVTEAARAMGAGLVSIINFYNPPRIILGGGVVGAIDLYFDLAKAMALAQALQVPRERVEIVKAALEDNSGIVGAAALAAGA
jgi:glucokinase